MITRFINAKIYQPQTRTFTDILLVSEGKVVAPSLSHDQTIDLNGKYVFPAFRDGHCHPLFAGREAQGPIVTNDKTVADIQQTLRSYREENPKSNWITGGAYDRSIVPDGRFLAKWIDEVISDVPVVLHASDHHTIWVNSKALEFLTTDNQLPKLTSGSIDIDEAGNPTGVLREPDAMKFVLEHEPKRSLENEVAALVWADKTLARLGIVEAQDAWIDQGMTAVYVKASQENLLLLDYNLGFRIAPDSWKDSLSRATSERDLVSDLGNEKLSANTTKFFADGVFGSGTASVLDPYLNQEENIYGEPLWSNSELFEACLDATKLQFQLHIHAIGDAGVRQALDAIEYVKNNFGDFKLPPVIAHAELIATTDIPRFAFLGVVANMQPLWAQKDNMLLSCLPRLGEERLDQMYRMRDLVSSGAKISFGSDWPVSSSNPLLGIATAVSRQTKDLEMEIGWTPDQVLTNVEALEAYSTQVRWQLAGTRESPLSIGTDADFIVVSENLIEISAQKLRQTQIEQTYKAGNRIF